MCAIVVPLLAAVEAMVSSHSMHCKAKPVAGHSLHIHSLHICCNLCNVGYGNVYGVGISIYVFVHCKHIGVFSGAMPTVAECCGLHLVLAMDIGFSVPFYFYLVLLPLIGMRGCQQH